MSRDKVLAVIPCLNEERHIRSLVEGLASSTQDLPVEIIIADGGSEDQTVAIARELEERYRNVKLMHNSKRIQSCAVNEAVRSHGDDAEFLIRLDAHADYPEDYCGRLVEEAQSTQAASVVVTLDTIGKSWFQRAVAAAQNSLLGNGGSAHRMHVGQGRFVDHGHHALMRIDAFKAVGGYDESFTHNEDGELDVRLKKAGYAIWLTGKTYCRYYPRTSVLSLFRQYIKYGYGRASNILKHRSIPKLRQLAPAAIAPLLLLALIAPFYPLAAAPFLIWCGLCLGYGIALSVKARDAAVLSSGVAAMIMHVGWSFGFWEAMIKKVGHRP